MTLQEAAKLLPNICDEDESNKENENNGHRHKKLGFYIEQDQPEPFQQDVFKSVVRSIPEQGQQEVIYGHGIGRNPLSELHHMDMDDQNDDDDDDDQEEEEDELDMDMVNNSVVSVISTNKRAEDQRCLEFALDAEEYQPELYSYLMGLQVSVFRNIRCTPLYVRGELDC